MGSFAGKLRVEDDDPALDVEIDVEGERMKISAGDVEIGDWRFDELRVSALVDGFHVRIAGEELVLQVEDDGRFALDLGLKTAHPNLRRRMAALIRERSESQPD